MRDEMRADERTYLQEARWLVPIFSATRPPRHHLRKTRHHTKYMCMLNEIDRRSVVYRPRHQIIPVILSQQRCSVLAE